MISRVPPLGAGLLGAWLLLGPPIRDVRPRPDAPLAEWKRYGTFATEGACLEGKALTRRMTGTEKYGWEKRYWEEFARCVETPPGE